MLETNDQLIMLFDEGETIGFRPNQYLLESEALLFTEFFVLNPLKDLSSSKLENVTKFRNVLIEIDGKSLPWQEQYIEEKLKLPFTTKVYSGNKSFHYILSLEQPMPDLDTYRKLVAHIYAVVKHADPACKNANRLTRLGGVIRSNGKEQQLLEVRKRISEGELHKWLFIDWGHLSCNAKSPLFSAEFVGGPQPLSFTTQQLLTNGIVRGSRHEALVKAAVDMKHKGLSLDEIENHLSNIADKIGLSSRGDVEGIMRWLAATFN